MELPSSIVVAIILLVILLIIVLYRFFGGPFPDLIGVNVFKGEGSSTPYEPFAMWGKATNIPDAQCQSYKFNTKQQQTFFGSFLVLGSPSLMQITNGNTSDYEVSNTPVDCIDQDTINAIKQYHTCDRTITPEGENYDQYTENSKCYTLDGELVDYGYKEYFYSYCPSGTFRYCNGEIGSAIIGYKSTYPKYDSTSPSYNSTFMCLAAVNTYDNNDTPTWVIKPQECDLSLDSQQFRVTRNNPGVTALTSTKGWGEGLKGQNIRFYHRSSGLCLYPNDQLDGLILRTQDPITLGFVWAVIDTTLFSEGENCDSIYPDPSITDPSNYYDSDGNLINNNKYYSGCINMSVSMNTPQCYNNCYETCRSDTDTCMRKNCVNVSDPSSYINTTCGSNAPTTSKPPPCKTNSSGNCSNFDTTGCPSGCENSNYKALRKCYDDCSSTFGTGDFYSSQRMYSNSQIVYIGNIPNQTIPTEKNGLYKFLKENQCKAISLNSKGDQFTLTNFQTTMPVKEYSEPCRRNIVCPPDVNCSTYKNSQCGNTDKTSTYSKACQSYSTNSCLGYVNPCDNSSTIKNYNTYNECMSYVVYDTGPQNSIPVDFILYNTLKMGVPGS